MRILPFHMLALELIHFYSSINLVELTAYKIIWTWNIMIITTKTSTKSDQYRVHFDQN